jgi:5'-3' exoribonuclease 1
MGIPHLYREIVKKDPSIIVNKIPDCTRLFLDFNGIIHNSANRIKSKYIENPNKYQDIDIEDILFKEIIIQTNEIVSACKPSELLYIAVDGVAPLAKQHQQRKRRYLSAYTNQIINEFKDHNNIPYLNWDSNQITPGTSFMINLNKYLKEYYSTNKFDYKVIVSGSDEAGEGEHKAIRYIKDQNIKNQTQTNQTNQTNQKKPQPQIDVIYGLDADLIMLTLTCGVENIYLMREADPNFNYIDIKRLRRNISLYLYDSEDISYMYDYVVICFLLGNDFLPNIPCLKLRFNGLTILCNTYKEIYNKLQTNLVNYESNKYKINYNFIKLLVETISKTEDKLMQEITLEYNKVTTNKPHTSSSSPMEKLMSQIDDYPLKNKMTDLIDPVNNQKWRMSYYHYLFDDHTESTIKSSVINYIEGLHWNINYYFNNEYSKTWHYSYNYAPCMTDLFKYISTIGSNFPINFKDSHIINESMQLLMVLPPQSVDILPNQLKPYMQNIEYGCLHYYPKQFKRSTYLKYFGWEMVPILPDINLDYLIDKLKIKVS